MTNNSSPSSAKTTADKIKTYISTHKKTSIFLGLVIVLVLYFAIHALTKSKIPTTYVLGAATKGTVVSTVTSTGQISTSSSLDLKPQVSGQLNSIRVKAGDKVVKGQVLFTISATDAARAVQTARNNVTSAKLDLLAFQTSIKNTTTDQSKTVKTAYATLLSSGLQAQPSDNATAVYQAPTISGNYILGTQGTITLTTYNSQGGVSFQTSGLVSATGLTNSTTAQPVGTSGLYILFSDKIKGGLTWTIDIPNKASSTYIGNENAYETAVENQNEAVDPTGSNAVTLQSKQLAIAQAENNLASAQETLAQYTIIAPFSGTMATSPEFVGDNVSSATTLGTLITSQEVVTLDLNEVDVSKVKVGDKATLTFDAVSDLTLTGTVQTVDPVGTVTSGVVNYTVTIDLDTQDDRIKSGMSVTAAIQTGIAADVLTVPSSAVKTANGSSYVLVVPSDDAQTPAVASSTAASQISQGITLATEPTRTIVEVGLSDGVTTEIKSGLTEGQLIVTKTITAPTATTTAATATSRTSSGFGAAGGSGAVRALGR